MLNFSISINSTENKKYGSSINRPDASRTQEEGVFSLNSENFKIPVHSFKKIILKPNQN